MHALPILPGDDSQNRGANGPVNTGVLTPRQVRELKYYEDYYRLQVPSQYPPVDRQFLPERSNFNRPWMDSWVWLKMIYESRVRHPDVLELACGQGSMTVQLASFCKKVTCIDLSPTAILRTLALCSHFGLRDRVNGYCMPCENIAFPSESFDVVVGRYILHHVDVGACAREVHRVLKTGGQAFFLEWIEWPPFDWFRTSRLVLHFFPREASLERHITQDERKLNQTDLHEIELAFGPVQTLRFHSLARVGKIISSLQIPAMKLDFKLFCILPAFRRTGGSVIISCCKV